MIEIIYFEIIDIDDLGITLKYQSSSIFICFNECAKNYASEQSLDKSKCVAIRDITNLTFIFYTNPKIKIVFKKNFIKDLFSKKSAFARFFELQKTINKYGYTSYDLS